jgi:major histocompatibility complex class I
MFAFVRAVLVMELFIAMETLIKPGVVAHAFNPSTWEAEAGGFLSSRTAWSTE